MFSCAAQCKERGCIAFSFNEGEANGNGVLSECRLQTERCSQVSFNEEGGAKYFTQP